VGWVRGKKGCGYGEGMGIRVGGEKGGDREGGIEVEERVG